MALRRHPLNLEKTCLIRQETSRRLRIFAKYEEACPFFGPFRVLTARAVERRQKKQGGTWRLRRHVPSHRDGWPAAGGKICRSPITFDGMVFMPSVDGITMGWDGI